MKGKILLIYFAFLTTIAFAQYPTMYYEAGPNRSREIFKRIGNYAVGSNSYIDGNASSFTIGRVDDMLQRGIYQWDISNSNIPALAVIKSIKISFIYNPLPFSTAYPNDTKFSNLNGINIVTPTSITSYWDMINNSNIGIAGTQNYLPNGDLPSETTFYPGSDFYAAFINALNGDHKFTIGISDKNDLTTVYTNRANRLNSYYLKLKIEYIVKQPGKTTTPTAFDHNGQKKAASGFLTYEDINRVWLEYNNSIVTGKPLDALEAKNPSLDNYYMGYTANGHGNCILVTYQEKQSDGTYKIKLDKISSDGTKLFSIDVFDSPNLYTRDASPLVVVGRCNTTTGSRITVVWKEYTNGSLQGGFYFMGGKENDLGTDLQWLYSKQRVASSDNSINPSMDAIDLDWNATGYNAILAWEENENIYYSKISNTYSGIGGGGLGGNLSSDHYAYTNHFKPSVTVTGGYARVGWLAGMDGDGAILMKTIPVDGLPLAGYLENIDTYEPTYVSLNKFNEEAGSAEYIKAYTFAGTLDYLYSSRLGNLQISTQHRYMQLSYTRSAYSYYSYSPASMVTFSNWSWDDDPFDKESIVATKNNPIHFKSISFVQDGVRSSLQIGNLKLGDEMLKFKDSGLDTIKSEFKEVLSETFAVNENSPVSFTLINKNKNLDEFKRDNCLKYSVEVVDANTNKTIKKVKEINVSKDKAVSEKINYTLDMKGVSASKIRIKLSAESNSPESMYVTDTYYANRVDTEAENAAVAMQEEIPAQYGLMQNYPNPFNPSTVISYDIPEASRVTLKVYDILGREVADLVNEFKEAGRYNVKFDASHLSTGIYIYRLRANDYVSVKKMSFVK